MSGNSRQDVDGLLGNLDPQFPYLAYSEYGYFQFYRTKLGRHTMGWYSTPINLFLVERGNGFIAVDTREFFLDNIAIDMRGGFLLLRKRMSLTGGGIRWQEFFELKNLFLLSQPDDERNSLT